MGTRTRRVPSGDAVEGTVAHRCHCAPPGDRCLGLTSPRMDLKLEGKVALVTGAGGGIGEAIATALCDEGCVVYLATATLTRLRARSRAAIPSDARSCSTSAILRRSRR